RAEVELTPEEPQLIAENQFNSNNLEPSDPDFWLTEKALFPEPLALQRKSKNLKTQSSTSGEITQKKPTAVNPVQKTVFSPASPSKSGSATTKNSLTTTKKQLQKQSNSDYDNTSDWIETQATPTGYIKHPLEQVLAVLDRTMFIIEELLLKMWKEIQQLFR
ncbi:MAG TPA: hypothetical protein VIQ31_11165, partial [Phormidium sp.]